MPNNYKQKLADAKLVVCQMIDQYLPRIKGSDGVEYISNLCESAGESAFAFIGIENDNIPVIDFLNIYDGAEDEYRKEMGYTKRDWTYVELYKKEINNPVNISKLLDVQT